MRCRVDSFKGQWMEIKSDSFKRVSRSTNSNPFGLLDIGVKGKHLHP